MYDETDKDSNVEVEEFREEEPERNYQRIRELGGYCILVNVKTGKRYHYTDEEVERAFLFYAVAGLTINYTALEMGWSREQFYVLKKSFNINHGDILPFTPEVIDTHSVEELIEKVRIFKKQYATKKYQMNKHKDQVREINRMNKNKFWFEEALKKIQPLPKEPIYIVPVYDKTEPDIQYRIDITDIHNGLEVDSIFNKQDMDETDRRMEYITNWIIENIPRDRTLLINDKGDIVHGLIHGSTEKYSDFVITALGRICTAYVIMMKKLIDAGFRIKFGKVNGNHASIEKNKKSRTDEENLGNVLGTTLKCAFLNDDRFEYIEKVRGLVHTIMPTDFGQGIMIAHGDETTDKKLVEKAKDIMEEEEYDGPKIIEVSCGHIHHYKAEDIEGILVEYTEPVVGTDQYASGKGFNQKPAFRVVMYDKDGRCGTRKVKIKKVA